MYTTNIGRGRDLRPEMRSAYGIKPMAKVAAMNVDYSAKLCPWRKSALGERASAPDPISTSS